MLLGYTRDHTQIISAGDIDLLAYRSVDQKTGFFLQLHTARIRFY
jgi:hypothetical protein